jgi:hypothetical protein
MTDTNTHTRGPRGHDTRWAIFEAMSVATDGDPYLDRLWLLKTPLGGMCLHRIHRADIERDPHDHPWWFASVVLSGGYTERVWPDKHVPGRSRLRVRGRWSLRCIGLGSAHIIESAREPLWTLVVAGPKRASWGFWPDGQFVPWRDYQYAPAPARPAADGR